jgi:hypothetical protein
MRLEEDALAAAADPTEHVADWIDGSLDAVT